MSEPTTDDGLSFWEKLTRRKLRNYLFLNRKLQVDFALLLAVVGAFNAIYFSVLVFFHSRESFIRLSSYIPEYLFTDEIFQEDYKLFITTVAFAVIGEAVFIGLLGLFFSHRIAGPLYAMSLKLQSIARGEIPGEVKLRKNDFLTEFADELNSAISNLRNSQSEISSALDDLRAGKKSECEERLKRLMVPEQQPGSSGPGDGPPQG